MMHEGLRNLMENISLSIGVIGILFIILGAIQAIWLYSVTWDDERYPRVRRILGIHLIIGLDFLVGKDIIDTFLLHAGKVEFIDLGTLITVVGIRIVLTYFLEKEINKVESGQGKIKTKKARNKS